MDFYHSEDFLAQINQIYNMINEYIKNYIRLHAHQEKQKEREACGVVYQKNKILFAQKCKNISLNPKHNFEISPAIYLSIKNDSDKISYIYHSHNAILDNDDFSNLDIKCAEMLGVPIILYSTYKDVFKIYDPSKKINLDNYIGRSFEIGKYDCFTLIKEFFEKEFNTNMSLFIKKDYKCLTTAQELIEENLSVNIWEKMGFKMLKNEKNLNIYDVLIIKLHSLKHFALYIGDEKILHQPINSVSRIDEYSNIYKKHTESVYRKIV